MSREAESRGFYTQMHAVLRERMLDATAEMICADGWQAVTMARVADRVGISRQSVYKEIGSKTVLGEAVVARETDRVLAGVIDRLRAHGADAASGIPDAAHYVLRTSADNPLIKAILVGAHDGIGAHGADSGLLPLLAIRPEPVLGRAIAAVRTEARVLYAATGLPPEAIDQASEIVIRLTLSHMQPTGPIEHAVAQVAALVEAVLGPIRP
jgi:AcrR family transcriptional regulator